MHPRPVNGLRHCSTPFLLAFPLLQFAYTLAKSQWIAAAHSLNLGLEARESGNLSTTAVGDDCDLKVLCQADNVLGEILAT